MSRIRTQPRADLETLLAHADTDNQREQIRAAIALPSYDAAAKSCGVTRSTIRSTIARLIAKAERRALKTNDPAFPAGQRLRGTSIQRDGAGNVALRWDKSERDSDPDQEPAEPVPPGFAQTRVSTLVDGQGNVRARWISADREKQERAAAFEAACREIAERCAGGAPRIVPPAPETLSGDWINVFPLGDPHIGMLAYAPESGDHHDLKIAVEDMQAAIRILASMAPPARKALLINLGDYFHAQDDRQQTPGHGHKLDVDGRWNKVVRAGLGLLAFAAETLLLTHEEVEIVNVPGNHDPDAARMIAIWLEAWFRHEPRVKVRDNASPYDAIEFGANMICTAHGDGAKREAVPGLFAARYPEMWGRAKYRVCYSGHVHHETTKEFSGMTVKTFRTLAAKDAWHSAKGYDSGRSLDVISHHVRFGPKRVATVDIAEVRESLR
jgi:hypothetical protein